MLDTVTLRVAFGVVGFCVVVLFYGVTYRTTRSSYSGWWCASLGLFLVSAVLFLLNGTPAQVVANPMGNTIAVLGAGCVWAAVRSLTGQPVARWHLLVAPVQVMIASFLDDPRHDIWTGGPYFLTCMAVMLGLATVELALVIRGQGRPLDPARDQVRFALWSLAVTSGAVAGFYLGRAVAFVAVGPDHSVFRTCFGSQATTLLTLVLLVVVTFSMSEMSHVEQTIDLRERATHDALTGVLNRAEFLRRTAAAFRDPTPGIVMVADLDGFKALNDERGHAAGDIALTLFATACREVVGDHGLVGRLGGDEFAFLLRHETIAERVADRIGRRFAEISDGLAITVSFGVAPVDARVGVAETLIRADVALYRAKAAGRDRLVRYGD